MSMFLLIGLLAAASQNGSELLSPKWGLQYIAQPLIFTKLLRNFTCQICLNLNSSFQSGEGQAEKDGRQHKYLLFSSLGNKIKSIYNQNY